MTSLSYCIESTVLSETSRRGGLTPVSTPGEAISPLASARCYQDGESRLKSNGKKATYSTELPLRNRGGEHGTYSYSEYCLYTRFLFRYHD